jgi:hypothetical protein
MTALELLQQIVLVIGAIATAATALAGLAQAVSSLFGVIGWLKAQAIASKVSAALVAVGVDVSKLVKSIKGLVFEAKRPPPVTLIPPPMPGGH